MLVYRNNNKRIIVHVSCIFNERVFHTSLTVGVIFPFKKKSVDILSNHIKAMKNVRVKHVEENI